MKYRSLNINGLHGIGCCQTVGTCLQRIRIGQKRIGRHRERVYRERVYCQRIYPQRIRTPQQGVVFLEIHSLKQIVTQVAFQFLHLLAPLLLVLQRLYALLQNLHALVQKM